MNSNVSEAQISQIDIRPVIVISNLNNITKKIHFFMRYLFVILHDFSLAAIFRNNANDVETFSRPLHVKKISFYGFMHLSDIHYRQ
jgi:hypothetical protein